MVEGADLGQQPQQHPEQDADGQPDADHQRRRDGALDQDGVAGQPGGPAEEPPAPLGHAVAGLVAPVDGHEQLEGDRPPVRGQVQVAGKGGLVAQGGLAGVAGPLERGHDARDGPGVGSQRRAERDPRVAVDGDVVDRPPARRLDGEGRLAVPAGPGHEAGRLAVGAHRAPADALETRVAVAEVEAAGEGAELAPVDRVRGQPQRPRRPERVRPARRPAAPGRTPAPDRDHAYRIDRTGRRLKLPGPPPSRPRGAGDA